MMEGGRMLRASKAPSLPLGTAAHSWVYRCPGLPRPPRDHLQRAVWKHREEESYAELFIEWVKEEW